MNHITRPIVLILLLLSKFVFASDIPKVFWDYGFGIQQFCAQSAVGYLDKVPIDGQYNRKLFQTWLTKSGTWTNEAIKELPSFQSAWERLGPQLLTKAIEVVGHPFERTELTVSLVLCMNLNSMGTPLLVNIPYYLSGPADAYSSNSVWKQKLSEVGLSLPLPISTFTEMTFHEVLHLYVMQIMRGRHSDVLSNRYKAESDSVKAHLHLFAIEKEVFERLTKESGDASYVQLLNTSQKLFQASSAKDYLRAWEIVNTDGAEAFIDELKGPEDTLPLCSFCKDGSWLSIEWILRLLR